MDETGHPDDPKIGYFGIAGFMATASMWRTFEHRWKSILKYAALREPSCRRPVNGSSRLRLASMP